MTTSRAAHVLRTAVVGLCATALLTLPEAPVSAAPPPAGDTVTGTAATRHDTSIRFLSFDAVRRYGSTTTIRGQVAARVNGRQGAVAGVRVKLLRKRNGTAHWRYLATTHTSSTDYPHFRFRAKARGNAHYRVRFGGNRRLQPAHNQTYVRVYRPISGRIEDGSGRFHGRVRPHYGHRTVYLAKRSCAACSWNRVRTDTTTRRGRYSFRVGAPSNGRWFWRVSTPGTTRFIRSFSAVFTTRLN